MKNAKVFDIQRYCINDGKGIRTVVFFKGCPLACKWCHNPQGLSSIDNNNVLEYSTNELLNEVLKDKDYYDTSGGGVTFSGGEATLQVNFLIEFSKLLKKENINIVLETSGYCNTENFIKICKEIDEIFFDIKLLNNELCYIYTKGKLDIILKNLYEIDKLNKPITFRCPIIGNVNDNENHIKDIIQLAKKINNLKEIHLLPYNELTKNSYERLNLSFNDVFCVPTKELLQTYKQEIENNTGKKVVVL